MFVIRFKTFPTDRQATEAITRHALTLSEWNVSRAARMLAVMRRTVYERMKAFGIKRPKVKRGVR